MELIPGIEKAFHKLDPQEQALICTAVLHGVPIRDLGPQEELQGRMINALRKLRKALTDQGLGPDVVRKLL
ncbi:MAG TPA: hypothetical protein VGO93_19050 [Candidatus Xenobia bacterium]|jgi:hypothetical protein